MSTEISYETVMKEFAPQLHPVIMPATSGEFPLTIDLSVTSQTVPREVWDDPVYGEKFFESLRQEKQVPFFYGGYREVRELYSRHSLFQDQNEPRNFHLGIDVWAPAGTQVYAPLDGKVHSFNFNEQAGDYGATIILQHQLSGLNFFALYGHLSLKSIAGLEVDHQIARGEAFASLGNLWKMAIGRRIFTSRLFWICRIIMAIIPAFAQFHSRKRFLKTAPIPDIFFAATPEMDERLEKCSICTIL